VKAVRSHRTAFHLATSTSTSCEVSRIFQYSRPIGAALVLVGGSFRRQRRRNHGVELFWFKAYSDMFSSRAAPRSLWNFLLSEYRDVVKEWI